MDNAPVQRNGSPAFQPLIGTYEPSAIQQLPDGRFLLVEDEKRHPLSWVTIGANGSVQTTALTAGLFQVFSAFWKLDDLEGLAIDRMGFVYAIKSHSRDDGNRKAGRFARYLLLDPAQLQPAAATKVPASPTQASNSS